MSTPSEQIRSTYDRLASAWRTNDGSTVAGFFTEDGTLVNPFGERADGRDAVAAMYSRYFGTVLRGSSTTIELGNVRRVDDDHAFVDSTQTIYDPNGSVVMVVHLAALLRREGDDWRLVDGRPYTYAAVPR
jgi:uncharacterized protein (TIGR02246 family)